MRAIDRYSRLQTLERPVLTTSEAAVTWNMALPAATRLLARLAAAGLVTKVRHGIWPVGAGAPDPALVLPVLTNPYPSYISGWSALTRHGMIEQIPRGVFAVSLDRTKNIDTEIGRFEVHHMHPDLFGGHEGGSGIRAGVATPAKALFDIVYLFSTRHGRVTLPELELPVGFDEDALRRWSDAVPSVRLRTLTASNLARLVATAAHTA